MPSKPSRSERDDPLERRSVFLAKDTPAEFLPQLEALARGDFAAAGVIDSDDERFAENDQRRAVHPKQARASLAKRTKI